MWRDGVLPAEVPKVEPMIHVADSKEDIPASEEHTRNTEERIPVPEEEQIPGSEAYMPDSEEDTSAEQIPSSLKKHIAHPQ